MAWAKVLNMPNISKSKKICYKHFKISDFANDRCFDITEGNIWTLAQNGHLGRLNKNAIPSKFLPRNEVKHSDFNDEKGNKSNTVTKELDSLSSESINSVHIAREPSLKESQVCTSGKVEAEGKHELKAEMEDSKSPSNESKNQVNVGKRSPQLQFQVCKLKIINATGEDNEAKRELEESNSPSNESDSGKTNIEILERDRNLVESKKVAPVSITDAFFHIADNESGYVTKHSRNNLTSSNHETHSTKHLTGHSC